MCFFFFNDTATTEIYPLSLHDALPIWPRMSSHSATTRREFLETTTGLVIAFVLPWRADAAPGLADRKSTRLNSSHLVISYAVFCLKKKKLDTIAIHQRTRRTARDTAAT